MSKKIRGNITPFGERIIKILKDKGLVKPNGDANYSKAERMCGYTGSFLSKAVRSQGMHEGNIEKFLRKFHVNPDWLASGKGDTYVENGTPGRKSDEADILEHPLVKNFVEQINTQREYIELLKRDIENLKRQLGR